MPGPPLQRYVLHHLTGAPDQEVAGHFEAGDGPEHRMPGRIQPAGKQLVDVRAAKLPGRERNAVDHDQIRHRTSGPVIAVPRRHLAHTLQQATASLEAEPAAPCRGSPAPR